jgi:hypothetical protein
MRYIKWFIRLRLLVLRNNFLKNKEAVFKTLSISLTAVIGQIILTNVLYRNILGSMDLTDAMTKGVTILFFFMIAIWIYLISLMQSLGSFMRNFYRTPDINYLTTLPIPTNYVFIFKLWEHIFSSSKKMLFLFFPFFAAVGKWMGAPLGYYISIIPVYFLISIIPCVIGAFVAIVGYRLIPAKVFNVLSSVLIFATNLGAAIIITRTEEVSEAYIAKVVGLFDKPFIADLIPITGGVKVIYGVANNERATLAFILLLMTSFLFMLLIFGISKTIFYEGWEKNQLVKSKRAEEGDLKARKNEGYFKSRIVKWMRLEWKMARRNHEMLMDSVFMLLIYFFAVFTFTYRGLFSENPLIGVFLLITTASIINVISISILFIPPETKNDKSIWRSRYWLLRTAPLDAKEIFSIQATMYFVPSFIISFIGVITYAVAYSLSLQLIIVSAFAMILILYGSTAIFVSVELISLNKFFDEYPILGNFITIAAPLLYGILSAGSISLVLLNNHLPETILLSKVSAALCTPIVSTSLFIILCLAVLLSKFVFVRTWDNIEIL